MASIDLSFSSAPRGARSGGKAAPAKKAKKQKREFRTTKTKAAREEKEVDLGAAKARALEGLAHLGKQRFTTEPGGYDLKHWLKSLNLLLDDLESKVKADVLPAGYPGKRAEVTARFAAGVDTSKLESEVEVIRKEEAEIKTTFDREKERITARLVTLKVEKDGKGKEIEAQGAELEEIRAKRKSASFFSKLVGKSGPPTEPVELKIKELEKGSASLEDEALNLQSVRASIERDGGKPSGLYEQQWLRLDAIVVRLKELEAEMQERTQLAKEREEATTALAELVSKIEPKAAPKPK